MLKDVGFNQVSNLTAKLQLRDIKIRPSSPFSILCPELHIK